MTGATKVGNCSGDCIQRTDSLIPGLRGSLDRPAELVAIFPAIEGLRSHFPLAIGETCPG